MNAIEFGYKLKQIRINKGFSLRQVEQQSINPNNKKDKITNSMISKIENGKRSIPKPDTLKELARGLRYPYKKLSNMAGYTSDIPSNAVKEHGPYRQLPVIGQIACGNPIDAIKTTGTYKLTDAIGLPSGVNYWLKCEGDSMFPTITNGSYVLIHQQTMVDEGHVAAAQMQDKYDDRPDVTLKRVVKQDKHIIVLKPDNSHFNPIILDKDNPGRIIGRAIKVEHDL